MASSCGEVKVISIRIPNVRVIRMMMKTDGQK